MFRTLKQLARMIVFLVAGLLILLTIQPVFNMTPFNSYHTERYARDSHKSFSEEEKGSLDAVYVGNSSVYAFWIPTYAYERYGIAVGNYVAPGMPCEAVKYVVDYCRQTQPNALYIINVNTFKRELGTFAKLHYVIDDMPYCAAKFGLVNEACEARGFGLEKRLNLSFPLLEFHSTWSELQSEDYAPCYADIKGASMSKAFTHVSDVSAKFANARTFETGEERSSENFEELLDYLNEQGVNALFVRQAQAESKLLSEKRYNYIRRRAEEEGFTYLDLSDPEDVGLNPKTDYYNNLHTNAHGALKNTETLASYLVDSYGFADKRGDESYASWEKAAHRMDALLKSRKVYDYELERATIDEDFKVTGLSLSKTEKGSVALAWDECEGADGYIVYRQQKKMIDDAKLLDEVDEHVWMRVAELSCDTLSWNDSLDVGDTTYAYSVIPIKHRGSDFVYGTYAVDPVVVNGDDG